MISLVYIPVILMMVLIITTPSKIIEDLPANFSSQEQKAINIQKKSDNPKSDYKAILSFIRSKFKKIKREDAEAISKYLVEFGNKNKIDPKFAAALIARESAFDKKAISTTGAKGLGQIKAFNFETLNIKNPFNIKENISGTTEYLRKMINKWNFQMNQTDALDKNITNSISSENNLSSEIINVKPQTQSEKVNLSLASYFKGFTAVKNDKGNLDHKTMNYIKDILRYYDEIINQTQ